MKNKAVGWIIIALVFGIPVLLSIPGSSAPQRRGGNITVPRLAPLSGYASTGRRAPDNSEVLDALRRMNSDLQEIRDEQRKQERERLWR